MADAVHIPSEKPHHHHRPHRRVAVFVFFEGGRTAETPNSSSNSISNFYPRCLEEVAGKLSTVTKQNDPENIDSLSYSHIYTCTQTDSHTVESGVRPTVKWQLSGFSSKEKLLEGLFFGSLRVNASKLGNSHRQQQQVDFWCVCKSALA